MSSVTKREADQTEMLRLPVWTGCASLEIRPLLVFCRSGGQAEWSRKALLIKKNFLYFIFHIVEYCKAYRKAAWNMSRRRHSEESDGKKRPLNTSLLKANNER